MAGKSLSGKELGKLNVERLRKELEIIECLETIPKELISLHTDGERLNRNELRRRCNFSESVLKPSNGNQEAVSLLASWETTQRINEDGKLRVSKDIASERAAAKRAAMSSQRSDKVQKSLREQLADAQVEIEYLRNELNRAGIQLEFLNDNLEILPE
jgi:hypothetical protein